MTEAGSVEEIPRARPTGRRSQLLLESVLIVLSVLLGFALSEWRERAGERALAQDAVTNFRREIEANLAQLERVQPKHAQFVARLAEAADVKQAAAGTTAFDVFAEKMPEGGLDTPALGEAAWEVATSTGALRLLDYDVAARLSQTYLIQRSTLMPTIRMLSERFMTTPNFDPAARAMMLRVYHMLMTELSGQEIYLIDIYRETLKVLPAR